MEAKTFLKQYQEALVDVRNLEAETEELETIALSITVSTDGERVQSSGSKDRMGELIAKICDMKIELMNKRSQALDKLREVGWVIRQVDNKNYRQLLHRRYIEGNTWERIAVEMEMNYRWILRMHGKALEKVEEILNKP